MPADIADLKALYATATSGEILCFNMLGWENARGPSITHDDPAGGDPKIHGEFARVYNPAALEAVVDIVNALPSLLNALDSLHAKIAELEGGRDALLADRDRRASLFDAIAHGDDEHRAWLKQAIDDHFAGRPVERVKGLGTTESLLAERDAASARVGSLATGTNEAILLIDEINERATSRKFHGIDQGLHAKLCTIRATLARARLARGEG